MLHQLTPEYVMNVTFEVTHFREGYDQIEVDDFLDRVIARMEKGQAISDLLDAVDFEPTRFREGYEQEEVDDLLAQLRRWRPAQMAAASPPASHIASSLLAPPAAQRSAHPPLPPLPESHVSLEAPRPLIPLPESYVIPADRRAGQLSQPPTVAASEPDSAPSSGGLIKAGSAPTPDQPTVDAVSALKGLSIRSRPSAGQASVTPGQRRYVHSMTADEVEHAIFGITRLRPAYDMGEVDQLLLKIIAALRSGRDACSLAAEASLTVVRWRSGYRMDEVDALLERLAAG